MRLLMDDRIVNKSIGVLQDVLVKVETFIFPIDFVILDCEVDFKVPIILGRSFLSTGHAFVDMEREQINFQLNNEEVTFNICKLMKHQSDFNLVFIVNYIVEEKLEVSIEGKLGVEALAVVIMNFDGEGIHEYDELLHLMGLISLVTHQRNWIRI